MKNNLRIIRKSKGYTIVYLSKMSGISIGAISNIENNLVTPNIYTVCCLARALHVHIEDIFPCTSQ